MLLLTSAGQTQVWVIHLRAGLKDPSGSFLTQAVISTVDTSDPSSPPQTPLLLLTSSIKALMGAFTLHRWRISQHYHSLFSLATWFRFSWLKSFTVQSSDPGSCLSTEPLPQPQLCTWSRSLLPRARSHQLLTFITTGVSTCQPW